MGTQISGRCFNLATSQISNLTVAQSKCIFLVLVSINNYRKINLDWGIKNVNIYVINIKELLVFVLSDSRYIVNG